MSDIDVEGLLARVQQALDWEILNSDGSTLASDLADALRQEREERTEEWGRLTEELYGERTAFLAMKQRAEAAEQALQQEQERAKHVEREYRKLLWLGHGHTMMYGDDGEMQCQECIPWGFWDYRREPLEKIEAAVWQIKLANLAKEKS